LVHHGRTCKKGKRRGSKNESKLDKHTRALVSIPAINSCTRLKARKIVVYSVAGLGEKKKEKMTSTSLAAEVRHEEPGMKNHFEAPVP
jgi:hypothetical protein